MRLPAAGEIYIFYVVVHEVKNIHPYLIEMSNIFIENRSKPLFDSAPIAVYHYDSHAEKKRPWGIEFSNGDYKVFVT